MLRLLFILGFALAMTQGRAATWFVRPLVYAGNWSGGHPAPSPDIYGGQDGTSYANAWNGLQSVVWGPSGVSAGDTLYVCGTNIARYIGKSPNTTAFTVWLTQSGVTLRGDYPGDAGFIFGGAIDGYNTYNWSGPDANGVYAAQSYGPGNPTWYFKYQVVNGSPVILDFATNTTWVGNNGAHYGPISFGGFSGSNYVKTVDGSVPVTTQLALQNLGWQLAITNGTSNIVFQSLSFYGSWSLLVSVPDYVNQIAATHISFTNCTMLQGVWLNPLPYQDNWNVVGCEIGYAPDGIYSYLNGQPRGAWGWSVVGNYIHDLGVTNSCGTTNWPGCDNHGVGVQGGCSWLVSGNTISNTGPSIDFWVGLHNAQTNNRVCYNLLMWPSCLAGSVQSGAGIVFEGTAGQDAGLASNNWIYGNVIMNTGLGATAMWQGAGIEWGQPDYCHIWNNTIYNAIVGIQDCSIRVPLAGEIVNNIIVNPATNFLYLVSYGTAVNLTLDHNVFYTNAPISQPFKLADTASGGAPMSNGSHTVFANPLFVSSIPASAADFQLQATSPAIKGGTSVGLAADFAGNPIPTAVPPSIGAYQFIPGQLSPPTNVRAVPPGH